MLHLQTDDRPATLGTLPQASLIPANSTSTQRADIISDMCCSSVAQLSAAMSQQHLMLLACRTKVEKQAAAASTIHSVGSRHTGATAGTSPQGETGAEKMPSLPRWDCSDGDTWHKRQRVYTKYLSCPSNQQQCLQGIADTPLRCFVIDHNTGEGQDAEHKG